MPVVSVPEIDEMMTRSVHCPTTYTLCPFRLEEDERLRWKEKKPNSGLAPLTRSATTAPEPHG